MNEIKNYWLGLNSYSENDILYGRDKETVELSEIVLSSVSSIMFGRSGIGKSSLLRAKIFPMLRYNDFFPVYVRLEHNGSIGYAAQIRNSIIASVKSCNNNKAYLTVNVKLDDETDDVGELVKSVEIVEVETSIRKTLVLVFDQFEEIFTMTDYSHKVVVDCFFKQIANLLNWPQENDFRLLFCIREDYIYCLEQVSITIPSLKRNRYRLKALDYEQAHQVICSPSPELLTDEISDAIINRLDRKNTGEIDPSILSLFMHELYEKGNGKITLESLNLFGDNIISEFYEESKALISASSAEFLENELVTGDGFRSILIYNDALNNGVTKEELDILKNKRIINIDKLGDGRTVIELSHDILCQVVKKNKDERKLKEEAEKLRSEAKAAKRRLNIFILLSLAALSVLLLFAYLFYKIKEQRDEILVSQARFVAKEAMDLSEKGEFVKAMALLANVYPEDVDDPDRPLVREVYDGLREINDSCLFMYKVLYGNEKGVDYAGFISGTDNIVTMYSDNYIRIWSGDGTCKDVLKVKTKTVSDGDNKSEKGGLWKEETGKTIAKLKGITMNNWAASVSPDGNFIATLSEDSTVVLRTVLRGDSIGFLKDCNSYITSVKFSPDGKHLVTTSGNFSIKIWNSENLTCLGTLNGHTANIISLNFSQDGNKIVSSSADGTVRIWDCNQCTQIKALDVPNEYLLCANFNKSADKVVICYLDGNVKYWDYSSSDQNVVTNGSYYDGSVVYDYSFNSDESALVTAGDDNIVRIYEKSSGLKRCLKGHSDRVLSAVFGNNDNELVSSSADGTAILWNIGNNDKKDALTTIINDVWKYALSPDEKSVATVTTENCIRIFDIETGNCLVNLPKQRNWVKSIEYSPDGKIVRAFLSGDVVDEWSLESGECVATYNAKPGNIRRTVVENCVDDFGKDVLSSTKSGNGEYYIISRKNNSVELRNVKTGKVVKSFKGHSNYVESVVMNDDNSLILTASRDCTARIWDVKSGKCLSVLRGHGRQVNSAVFIDNDNKVMTLSNDNTIRIWTVISPQKLIDMVREKLNGYQLSKEDRYKYYLD